MTDIMGANTITLIKNIREPSWIFIGFSQDFHRLEIPLGKTREIDNEARISKKAKMKRKFNRNQKRITPLDIQLSSLTSFVAPTGLEFQITGAKWYVPVVTLSTENDKTFLEQLKIGFERTIKWNKYRSEMTNQAKNNNLNYLIDPKIY